MVKGAVTTQALEIPEPSRRTLPKPLLAVLYSNDWERIGERGVLPDDLAFGRQALLFGGGILDDPLMSRIHATFKRTAEGFLLTDEQSKNGTFVDGEKIRQHRLRFGDAIQIGDTFFQFLDAPPVRPTPQASLLVGTSPYMDELRRRIGSVAPHPTTVLITGEPGVGKHTVARELHRLSERTGEIIPVDCRGVGDEQLGKKLFGSGDADTESLLLREGDDTVLLEDVESLSPALQLRLQRSLSNWDLATAGEPEARGRRNRIIATSEVDLAAAVASGRFLRELYDQLLIWDVAIPPLRERKLDQGALLAHYIRQFGREGMTARPDFVWRILKHTWPGNARQLAHVVEAACIEAWGHTDQLTVTAQIDRLLNSSVRLSREPGPADTAILGDESWPAPPAPQNRDELMAVMREHDFVISRVAAYYRKHRQQIYRWLDRFEIDPSEHRGR